MSARLTREEVLFRQRLLSCSGFYTDTLDGRWGRNTETADNAFHARAAQIAAQVGTFDARSERNIATLRIQAQEGARRSLKAILAAGIRAKIISGNRTYAEQNAIFRQGRFGNPGPRVTNARGGESLHNFGLAWDIGIFTDTGAYVDRDDRPYKKASDHGKVEGVSWGGNWSPGKEDYPHYQWGPLAPSVTQLRTVFEAGCR